MIYIYLPKYAIPFITLHTSILLIINSVVIWNDLNFLPRLKYADKLCKITDTVHPFISTPTLFRYLLRSQKNKIKRGARMGPNLRAPACSGRRRYSSPSRYIMLHNARLSHMYMYAVLFLVLTQHAGARYAKTICR